jgi:hypothetical protein
VNAGHLPPLLISPAGVAYLDGGAGVLLGLESRPPVPESVALTPGTRLLLMTDGLVERRSRPLADTMETLARTLASAHRAGPDGSWEQDVGSIDDLADDLLRRADSSDDVALVVIETTPRWSSNVAYRRPGWL